MQAHAALEGAAVERSSRICHLEEQRQSGRERIALLEVECESLHGEVTRLHLQVRPFTSLFFFSPARLGQE